MSPSDSAIKSGLMTSIGRKGDASERSPASSVVRSPLAIMRTFVAYVTAVPPRHRQETATEQRDTISRWASRSGMRIAAWHEEQTVGKGLFFAARPALMDALLDMLRRGKEQTLVIASRKLLSVFDQAIVDRLARRAGGKVLTADGTTASAETLRLFALLESHEQALASLRARATRPQPETQGAAFGKLPWGYRRSADGKRVLRDAREQRVLAVAAHMRANGLKFREIAEELSRLGLRSRRGRPIGTSRVFEMLRDIETLPRFQGYREVLSREDADTPRHYRRLQPSDVARAATLRARGLSVRAVAEQLGIPRATIHKALHRTRGSSRGV
jgi:DNA invertase Pin-like site-specific DNA recombinase